MSYNCTVPLIFKYSYKNNGLKQSLGGDLLVIY